MSDIVASIHHEILTHQAPTPCTPQSVAYIMKWFASRPSVELILGSRVVESTSWVGGSIKTYTLEGGRRLVADVTYDCRGSGPSTGAFKGSLPSTCTTPQGYMAVNDAFQVESHQRVFALGDAARMEGGARPGLGHTAEYQARTVCENVRRVCSGRALCR